MCTKGRCEHGHICTSFICGAGKTKGGPVGDGGGQLRRRQSCREGASCLMSHGDKTGQDSSPDFAKGQNANKSNTGCIAYMDCAIYSRPRKDRKG